MSDVLSRQVFITHATTFKQVLAIFTTTPSHPCKLPKPQENNGKESDENQLPRTLQTESISTINPWRISARQALLLQYKTFNSLSLPSQPLSSSPINRHRLLALLVPRVRSLILRLLSLLRLILVLRSLSLGLVIGVVDRLAMDGLALGRHGAGRRALALGRVLVVVTVLVGFVC